MDEVSGFCARLKQLDDAFMPLALRKQNREGSDADPCPSNSIRQYEMLEAWTCLGAFALKMKIVEIAAIEAEAEHEANSISLIGDERGTEMIQSPELDRDGYEIVDERSVDPHSGSCLPYDSRWPSQPVPKEESQAQRFSSPIFNSQDGDSEPVVSPGRTSTENQTLPAFRSSHSSWQLVLNDARSNEGNRILAYLMQLHPKILGGFIKGDLPMKRREDPEIETILREQHWRQERQGTYAVYVSRRKASRDGSCKVGSSLTPNELEQVYSDMEMYIDVDHRQSRFLAQRIDKARPGNDNMVKHLNYSFQRRYGHGTQNDKFEHHRVWLDFIKRQYIDGMTALSDENPDEDDSRLIRLREPLDRCFAYVGLSSNILRRCPDHWTASGGISPVFGLFMAILQYRFPNDFSCDDSTWQVFKTVDANDIGFDEKLTTILLSGYPWDGGLSTAYAGVNIGNGQRLARDPYHSHAASILQSARDVQSDGNFAKNLDDQVDKVSSMKARREGLRQSTEGYSQFLADAEAAVNARFASS